jgi:hypothetical protein
LTDADRKWMVNAEYGGTGGKAIVEFMCVEEPDIEIGAGVSSKGLFFFVIRYYFANMWQQSLVVCKLIKVVQLAHVQPGNL